MYTVKLNNKYSSKVPAVITIGNFDGVHLGHQQLISQVQQIALENNYKSIVLTFEPSPFEYFAKLKDQAPSKRLSLLRDKFLYLKQLKHIDKLVVLHFNARIANLTPKEFIDEILIKRLNVQHIIIGHDFRFGKGAQGCIADLENAGITCSSITPFKINDMIVSSSYIRRLLKTNQLKLAKAYLGKNIRYTSRVIHGNNLGHKFGVATINLDISKKHLALHGIYIAYAYIDETRYMSAVSIGTNPSTSNTSAYKLEAHLLDTKLNLYGKIVTIEILEFIRKEEKYSDLDKLFWQIKQDIKVTRQYFLDNMQITPSN